MSRDVVTTELAPRSPFYSQAVKAADLIFVSGQVGQDPRTGKLAGPTVGEQTRQCLRNVRAILEAAGSSMDKIVTATFILRNSADFVRMNEEWGHGFSRILPHGNGRRFL